MMPNVHRDRPNSSHFAQLRHPSAYHGMSVTADFAMSMPKAWWSWKDNTEFVAFDLRTALHIDVSRRADIYCGVISLTRLLFAQSSFFLRSYLRGQHDKRGAICNYWRTWFILCAGTHCCRGCTQLFRYKTPFSEKSDIVTVYPYAQCPAHSYHIHTYDEGGAPKGKRRSHLSSGGKVVLCSLLHLHSLHPLFSKSVHPL